MKRPRRRTLQENLVKIAIDILEDEIDPMFHRSRRLKRLSIHKQKNNKYFKMIIKTVGYLEELRGDYRNPIEDLLRDYYMVVFNRFKDFGRVPTLSNLSPSANNKIAFEESVYEFTAENLDEYWISELTEAPEIIYVPVIPEDIDIDPSFIEV